MGKLEFHTRWRSARCALYFPETGSGVATSLVILRFGLVALMAVLWALRRKHALFQLIIIANALFTIALLIQTSSLISALFGGASEAINALLLDVALMATLNILIFSVWYWVIDPPGIELDPIGGTTGGRI